MSILALVLMLLSAAVTVPFLLLKKGPGPEGPVGMHMVTAPGALLGSVALGIAVFAGVWDFGSGAKAIECAALPGYAIAMTLLPILALPNADRRGLATAATAAALAAGIAASGAPGIWPAPLALRIATGVPLAAVALGGWGVVGALYLQSLRNAAAVAADREEQHNRFEEERIKFDGAEWAKLPETPGLWQLIQYTHSPNTEVRNACHAKIAARPALEADTIALLGTGWAQHALAWLEGFYTLPMAPLAPAYSAYLEKELGQWTTTLANDVNPAKWEANLRPILAVAAKIAKAGGDVRAPLQRWHQVLSKTRGLEVSAAQAAAGLA